MTTYYDTALDAADINALLPVLAEPNIIGPLEGRADIVGSDPARFYVRVRTTAPLALPVGCALTPTEVADALLGVWA